MSKTHIGWTDNSWNPYLWRCRKVSQGCKNCYMMALATRYGQDPTGPFGTRWEAADKELKTFKPGEVVFVNSMSDTYYERASDDDVMRVHATAARRPDLTFLVLTKRPERALALASQLEWPRNLWLGVSVENKATLPRISYALATPAAGVFVSAEPLLEDIGVLLRAYASLQGYVWHGQRTIYVPDAVRDAGRGKAIGWVIVGGESGPERRPFDWRWAASIQHTCAEFDVPFFYKQGSAFMPGQDRLLEGRTWDEMPAAFSQVVPSAQQLTLFAAMGDDTEAAS